MENSKRHNIIEKYTEKFKVRWKLFFALMRYAFEGDRLAYVLSILNGLRGGYDRKCSLCGFHGKFVSFGMPPRFDAKCPSCGSLERHRLFFLACYKKNYLERLHSLLHFAPEVFVETVLRHKIAKYVTADLYAPNSQVVLNIEKINLPDQCYDSVLCIHVLEHVDDRKAISEIHRILKPGGLLFAMVPLCDGWSLTYENDAITEEADRTLHFGQHDHVRYYGADFRDRLRQAGFNLDEFTASGEDVVRYGLMRGETLFICKKISSE